jgi:para-aminobenzoate synthetase component I
VDRYRDHVPAPTPAAWFNGLLATRPTETSNDPARLDRGGWWAVAVTFEGEYRLHRFEQVDDAPLPPAAPWRGVGRRWRSSLSREQYMSGVEEIRRRIHEGEVYQVNLCRVLETADEEDRRPGEDSGQAGDDGGRPWALAERLRRGNPAPYAGVIDVPGTRIVCASPELFLERAGDLLTSGPIKGTGATEDDLLPKDEAENIMIVDLVRNDLQRVSRPGSVRVTDLLKREHHPGLVHLVSRVEGRTDATWEEILAALLPPGSVSGAPKSTALTAIRELEPTPRGPYCGAVGYVDADRGTARLAVGIRTFWWSEGKLRFGTGAGITADSDPAREWAETELKAARLIRLASSSGNQASKRVTAASRSR